MSARQHWSLRMVSLFVFVFLMAPLVVVVLASFSPTSYISFPPKGFVLKWYAKALAEPAYMESLRISLVLGLSAVAVATATGVLAALALIRYSFPGKTAIENFLMSPLMLPQIVIGVALLVFYSQIGLIGSFAGLTLGHAVLTIPYVIRSVLVSLHGLDPALEEAARTLGADSFRVFTRVTLPLIRPGVIAGAVFAFIISFDNVPVSIFIGGSRLTTLPVQIYAQIQYGVDPTVAAVSTVLVVVTAGVLLLLEWLIRFTRFVS